MNEETPPIPILSFDQFKEMKDFPPAFIVQIDELRPNATQEMREMINLIAYGSLAFANYDIRAGRYYQTLAARYLFTVKPSGT